MSTSATPARIDDFDENSRLVPAVDDELIDWNAGLDELPPPQRSGRIAVSLARRPGISIEVELGQGNI